MELEDIKTRIASTLQGNPLYRPLLLEPVMAYLSSCRSLDEAFLSEVILSLVFRSEGFEDAAQGYADVAHRINDLEAAIPSSKRSVRAARTLRLGIDFDHAAYSGMNAVDAAVHALRKLGAESVRMLPPPRPKAGVRGPDAEARNERGPFPIEAMRLWGRRGFAQLSSVLNSILASAFIDGGNTPGVQVRTSRGVVRDMLNFMEPDDLAILHDRFRELLEAFRTNGRLERTVELARRGRKLDFKLRPKGGPFVLFSPGLGRPASALAESYPGWNRIERRIRATVRDHAVPQLAAFHPDGKCQPEDLAFITVPIEGERILYQKEIGARLTDLAEQLRMEHAIRVEIRQEQT